MQPIAPSNRLACPPDQEQRPARHPPARHDRRCRPRPRLLPEWQAQTGRDVPIRLAQLGKTAAQGAGLAERQRRLEDRARTRRLRPPDHPTTSEPNSSVSPRHFAASSNAA
ncbi:MAG: hypothetical protein MZV63_66705 [Marinilabiliales bacterium]|nr:hypothetical protein [Marinilabiliales bacterium]